MSAFKKIDAKLLEVERDVLTLLLTEVNKILQQGKYDHYVMAMGCWGFDSKSGAEYNYYETKKKVKFAKIEKIFEEYGEAFKLTGNSIWLRQDGTVCYHWTSSPTDEQFEKATIQQIVKKLTTYTGARYG